VRRSDGNAHSRAYRTLFLADGFGSIAGTLCEPQPFRYVSRKDEATSIAAPCDVRSRECLQKRHTDEPSPDDAPQGEIRRGHHLDVPDFDLLRAVDRVTKPLEFEYPFPRPSGNGAAARLGLKRTTLLSRPNVPPQVPSSMRSHVT